MQAALQEQARIQAFNCAARKQRSRVSPPTAPVGTRVWIRPNPASRSVSVRPSTAEDHCGQAGVVRKWEDAEHVVIQLVPPSDRPAAGGFLLTSPDQLSVWMDGHSPPPALRRGIGEGPPLTSYCSRRLPSHFDCIATVGFAGKEGRPEHPAVFGNGAAATSSASWRQFVRSMDAP